MDKVAITRSLLDNLADHINTKAGTTGPKTIEQMQNTVDGIDTAEPMQEKSVEITENGTTEVTPDTEYGGLSKVQITVDVPATPQTPTEDKTVDLDMADGNQVVDPTAGYVMSKLTINKPDTMLPENIKKDVNIGGVVGSYDGGGTGEQAQLFAPAIALDVYQLTITNNSQNGGFLPTSYEGFANGVSVGTKPGSGEVTTIDTSPLAETGETSAVITVTAKRDGFLDSQPSNAVNWERYYTVTFYDGDTVLKTGLVQNGVTIADAQPPTQKAGYNFVGWFSDSALTEVVDETTAVESEMVLYGEWEVSVYISPKGEGFNLPNGGANIDISPSGTSLLINDNANYKIHIYKITEDGVSLSYTTLFGSSLSDSKVYRAVWITDDMYAITGAIYKDPCCIVYKADFQNKKSVVQEKYTTGLPTAAGGHGSMVNGNLVITGFDQMLVLDVTTTPFTVLLQSTSDSNYGGTVKAKLTNGKYVVEKGAKGEVHIFDFSDGSYTTIRTSLSSVSTLRNYSGAVGNSIAVLKSGSELIIYDGSFDTIKHTVSVSSANQLVVNKDGKAIVSVSGGLQVIDINDGSTVQTIETDTRANYLNLGQDWKTLYCGNTTSGAQTAYSLKYESVDQV
nr:MAG TPA: hypothetical protein [Caudoviricetes sp.]